MGQEKAGIFLGKVDQKTLEGRDQHTLGELFVSDSGRFSQVVVLCDERSVLVVVNQGIISWQTGVCVGFLGGAWNLIRSW